MRQLGHGGREGETEEWFLTWHSSELPFKVFEAFHMRF